ncbi:hypothetical protein PINS_up008930 [Pythium insidiosum]|nr:hypothetical protein PINS_up008930 [Pythium insidiosum]
MKSWAPVVGAGVLALATTASGVLVKFNENFMAASSEHRNGISFSTHDVDPLPHNAFMTMQGYYGPKEGYPCAESSVKNATSDVYVLIAISKCLNQSSIDNIKQWVDQVKTKELTYFSKGEAQSLKFETTLVPGDCQSRTEREKKGQTEQIDWEKKPYNEEPKPAEFLLSNEVLPGEIERIAAFAKFGRVLQSLPSTTTQDEIPIAVVSFVNNELSYKEVEQFEKKSKITQAFNFQICDKGKSCEGKYENCVFLQEDVDLFMYNPFTVIRTFECDSVLPDAVPVSYIDAEGQRKCFCACPAKYELVKGYYGKDRCDPITKEPCQCAWDAHPFGYRIENTENLRTCLFCDIANKDVPVPFPVDNYVADGRKNRYDSTTINGPHVDLAVTPLYSDIRNEIDIEQIFQRSAPGLFASSGFPPTFKELIQLVEANHISVSEMDQSLFRPFRPATNTRGYTTSNRYTWRTFQTQRVKKINDLEFTSYGKYELFIDAVDYTDSATCTGCVAFIDKFRPEATTKCPKSFCDNSTDVCDGADEATAELTPDNQEKADAIVKGVYAFGEEATNDVCSEDRCDEQLYSYKNFFKNSYESCDWSNGKKCFDKDEVVKEFVNNPKAKANPLVELDAQGKVCVKNVEIPVKEGKCTRCCKASTTLREFWTDYSCGCDFDVRRCSAGSDDAKTKCGAKQCLTMFGDTLAHVSSCIKPDVVEESERVLSKLVQEGQTVNEVHRSISCPEIDKDKPACRYEAKMTDLFDVSAEAKILEVQLNPNDYIFWRYKVIGQNNGWRLFTPDTPAQMKTETFVQAKTKIILEAWTNCGLARRFFYFVHIHVTSDIAVCDYFSDMWYQTSSNRLPITSTVCAYDGSDFAEVTFDYRPFAGLKYKRNELRPDVTGVQCKAQIAGRQSVNILTNTQQNPEIIQRYAVELLNTRRTNATTTVKMECTFTYTFHDKTSQTKTCRRTITMQDCNPPEYNDADGECLQQCANRNKPGPYEACGGQIISHNAQKTLFSTGEKQCCQQCSRAQTKCTAILGLKNEKEDIKRCVPEVSEYANYGYTNEGYAYVVPYADNENVENEPEEPENPPVNPVNPPVNPVNPPLNPANPPPLMLSAAVHQLSSLNASAAMLLFASGMVAVLAVVVVRGRRAAAAKPPVAEDAYYPLLH